MMSFEAIARLECVDRSTTPPTHVNFSLKPGKTLRFGRDDRTNDYVFDSASFSRNHMEFYSVVFEEGAEPMVYVRDRQSANGTWVNDDLVGKGHRIDPGRLLEHNDKVTIKPHWSFKVKLLAKKRHKMTKTQKEETKLFSNKYTITNMVIGEGVSTKVRLAYDVKNRQQLACKIYDLQKLRDSGCGREILKIMRSLKTMSQIEHPNISSFRRAYKSEQNLYVFEELASGGDLFSLVQRLGEFKETEARYMICQVLRALEYLHAKDVAHRDIKLENVLCMVCPKPAHRIALTDFGHVGLMTKGRLKSTCGTKGWQAPEQFKPDGEHGLAIDMWAVGIMAVQLLTGNAQLQVLEELEHALPANPSIDSLDFEKLFHEINSLREQPVLSSGENFIRQCLQTKPGDRMTAAQALKHPWMSQPYSAHLLFQSRQQETVEGWKPRKVHFDLIRQLPKVLVSPTQPEANTKKREDENTPAKRKQSIFGNHERSNRKASLILDKSRYFFGKVTKKSTDAVDSDLPVLIDGETLRKVRDDMSTRYRVEMFGKHGIYGDLSTGGRAVNFDQVVSPRRPRFQRDQDKLKLLEELEKKGVNFLPRNMTWPLKSGEEEEEEKGRHLTKRNRSDESSSGRAAKRAKVVLDPADGKPINFEDPWTPV